MTWNCYLVADRPPLPSAEYPTARGANGIEPCDAVIVADCGGELRLKPGSILEVKLFSDEAIAEWEQADALPDQERQQILKRLQTPPRFSCCTGPPALRVLERLQLK